MDKDFEKMYNSLSEYENQLHERNQKRIGIGIKCILIIPLVFLSLMFITNSSKDIFLILWIVSLFILAIYLILVEYNDYKLQEKLSQIRGDDDAVIQPLIPDEINSVESKLVKTIKIIDENINSKEELRIHNKEASTNDDEEITLDLSNTNEDENENRDEQEKYIDLISEDKLWEDKNSEKHN